MGVFCVCEHVCVCAEDVSSDANMEDLRNV